MLKKFIYLLAAIATCVAVFGCSKAGPPVESTTASVETVIESSVEESVDSVKQAEIIIDFVIDGSAAEKNGYDVNYSAQLSLAEDSTVYDALEIFARERDIEIEGDPSYVTRIDGLGEKDTSLGSGWVYYLNGEMVWFAANECKLKDGDTVIWTYYE